MTAGDSSIASLTERTAFLAHKVGQLLLERVERRLEVLGLNSRSYFVLAAVDRDVPRSQQELSRLLTIDPTTIVALVDDLEAHGHVQRSRNLRDRRRYDLTLSDGGVRALAAAHEALATVEQDFFAPLTPKQRGDLHKSLERLIVGRWPPPG
jgi:DNA-binding MarR family transcriptional regulator